MENMAHQEPSKLPYKLLKQITKDFDQAQIIGTGGFGTVYKGVYEHGGEIAVKVLHSISVGQHDQKFQKEFDNLRGLKHPNIVEFVGFCNELVGETVEFQGEQVIADRLRTALCFEYVHNGSLQERISDEYTGLNWHTRYRIIKGICQGLRYLHEGLDYPIIHLDLKPHNILLDKNMMPKIADFGISRLFGEENTKKTMSAVGTIGYWPPEYIKHQIISKEFDIFSLGVIIVKIMTGHKGYNSTVDMAKKKSVRLVHESWRKQLHSTLCHASLEVFCNQVKTCIEIALDCLKSNRQERPTIQDIVSSLNKTETMIGDRKVKDEQFYQNSGESSTVLSGINTITINSKPSGRGEVSMPTSTRTFFAMEPSYDMTWSLLNDITDDFSEDRLLNFDRKGSAYKGVYENGKVITVRRIYTSREIGDKQFQQVIESLKSIHHQNVVRLVGYCHETGKSLTTYNERPLVASYVLMAMCFEYLPNGSLDQYISDISFGLDWQTRYGIIKGVCEGLKYLHEGFESPILHVNLKLTNILLDENMMPKIGDFAMQRCIGKEGMSTDDVHPNALTSTRHGHMPPEFIQRQVISKEFDIYSLGVVIIELMTGHYISGFLTERVRLTILSHGSPFSLIFIYSVEQRSSPRELIELVHEEWRERLQETVHATSLEGYCEQVEICLKIGLKCIQYDRLKRPTIGYIIDTLNGTEPFIHCELLDVHPSELGFFPFMPSMESSKEACTCRNTLSETGTLLSSSLQLHNKADDRVAFMLKSPWYLREETLFGVVPPKCVNTLVLKMHKHAVFGQRGDFFTLWCAALGEYDLQDVDKDSIAMVYNNFFKKAKEVQKVELKVVCYQQPDHGTSCEIIKTTPDAHQVPSMDVHPTEPWIVERNHMGMHVFNYQTMPHACPSFRILQRDPVNVIKIIAREKWLAMGANSGYLHVIDYHRHQRVKSFHAQNSCITLLIVHPTHPFVLSSSDDDEQLIKLWDWQNNWKCTREFQGHTNKVTQIMFNPEDNDSFASASLDGTVKIWSFRSGNTITLKLNGHVDGYIPEGLLCIDYFTRHKRQHLIAGSKDKTALIWDLMRLQCVEALEGHADSITVVKLHPELPLLITGSLDGTVRVWNSTTYKLENIIDFNLGAVYALGCIKWSARVVVQCHKGMAKVVLRVPR